MFPMYLQFSIQPNCKKNAGLHGQVKRRNSDTITPRSSLKSYILTWRVTRREYQNQHWKNPMRPDMSNSHFDPIITSYSPSTSRENPTYRPPRDPRKVGLYSSLVTRTFRRFSSHRRFVSLCFLPSVCWTDQGIGYRMLKALRGLPSLDQRE